MDRFRRLVASRHGVDLPDTVALHAWSVEHLGQAWQAVWDTGERGRRPRRAPPSIPGDGTMARRAVLPRGPPQPGREPPRRPGRRQRPGHRVPAGGRPAPHAHVGAAPGRGGSDGRRAAGRRRRAPATGWRRGCRTCPRRWWRSWPPARSARSSRSTSSRLRHGRRGRPLRPDRADRAVRRRRLPLRRQGVRLPRPPRRAAGAAAQPCARWWSSGTWPTSPPSPPSPGIASFADFDGAPTATTQLGLRAPARSTTRLRSSTRRAPPGRRSASCTAPAACC